MADTAVAPTYELLVLRALATLLRISTQRMGGVIAPKTLRLLEELEEYEEKKAQPFCSPEQRTDDPGPTL